MRRVPEVIDCWFDSGSMPFAQWHYPFENEELFARRSRPTTSARRSTRRAAGSTRCTRSRRWCSTRRRTGTSSASATSSTRRARRCPSRWQHRRAVGRDRRHGADAFRWYYLTSKQPWDGYLFSTETVGESVRRFLLQLWNTYGFYVLYANANEITEPGEPETELDRWAISRLGRDDRRGPRADGRLRRDARRPGDRDVRGRALQLVRAPLAPALLGRRPGGVRHVAHLPGRGHEAARAVLPVRRRRDLREPRRQPCRACTWPISRRRASATSSSRRRWPSHARPCGSGWPRAGTASSRCASRCVTPSSSRRATSAPRSSASPRPCARSSTSRRCASSPGPTSSAPTR